MKSRLVKSELGIDVKTGRIEQACQRYGGWRGCLYAGGWKAGMKGIIDLADVQESPAAVIAFYDRFRGKIVDIETVEQRNNILSEMQQDFETEVRQEPQNRDKLSEVYQLLKRKCWEVGLFGNG